MDFTRFEEIMHERGIKSLAEIARYLDTTPQAVSNWKSRNRVPYHVISELNINQTELSTDQIGNDYSQSKKYNNNYSAVKIDEQIFSFSDILLIVAEQIKVIFISIFLCLFYAFTYTQFIEEQVYTSYVKVLFPSNSGNNVGGLAGIASQFGVDIPGGSRAYLSNPSFFPELIKSRTFAEKILEKNFYTQKFEEELPLLSILTHGKNLPSVGKDTLITNAQKKLNGILKYESSSGFNIIKVTTFEALLAKQLAEAALLELEGLNRYYKNQTVREKINFIDNRIYSVNKDLEKSEKKLKEFKENNRQVISPALQLEQDRLNRDVEVQKGIFLTLKQQLELAKIEAVQQGSIVQVLDPPQIPLGPENKNLRRNMILALFVGLGLGVLLGFLRNYFDNDNIHERKKLRRVRLYLKKKTKDIFTDYRISGAICTLMLIFSPYYFGHQSKAPVFFGMYSTKLMVVNIAYLFIIIISMFLFIKSKKR